MPHLDRSIFPASRKKSFLLERSEKRSEWKKERKKERKEKVGRVFFTPDFYIYIFFVAAGISEWREKRGFCAFWHRRPQSKAEQSRAKQSKAEHAGAPQLRYMPWILWQIHRSISEPQSFCRARKSGGGCYRLHLTFLWSISASQGPLPARDRISHLPIHILKEPRRTWRSTRAETNHISSPAFPIFMHKNVIGMVLFALPGLRWRNINWYRSPD